MKCCAQAQGHNEIIVRVFLALPNPTNSPQIPLLHFLKRPATKSSLNLTKHSRGTCYKLYIQKQERTIFY